MVYGSSFMAYWLIKDLESCDEPGSCYPAATRCVSGRSVSSSSVHGRVGPGAYRHEFNLLDPEIMGSIGGGQSYPKGPCSCMVYIWALKGFLYLYALVYLFTRMILGPFGKLFCLNYHTYHGLWGLIPSCVGAGTLREFWTLHRSYLNLQGRLLRALKLHRALSPSTYIVP